MDIFFPDDRARELFCCRNSLIRQYGDRLAKLICCRLSVLDAAPCLADLPTNPPIELAVEGKSIFSVALGLSHRLTFRDSAATSTRTRPAAQIKEIEMIGLTQAPTGRGKLK